MASHFTQIKAKVFTVPQGPKTSSHSQSYLPLWLLVALLCPPVHSQLMDFFLLLYHAKGVPNPFRLPRNLFPNVSASLTSLLRCLLRCQFSVRIFLTTKTARPHQLFIHFLPHILPYPRTVSNI